MNDLIAVPTVEQINLEHQLANSKANEAVQHATNCGLMLLQVKASKQHGEWLPWLNGEIDSGRLKVKARQANTYMKIASNPQRDADLLEAPSIRAALELLSDKEPEEQQGTLIDVEAERKAREAAERQAETERQARLTAEQRNTDWAAQNKVDRDKLKALELDLLTAKSQTAPEPEKIEVIPPDYETAKAKATQLESELAKIKKEQDMLINSQVKAKLHEYQSEVNEMEIKKAVLKKEVDSMKDYMASLEGESRRIEVHQQVIEEQRLKLISLAAFLSDEEPMHNADTAKRWRALGDMLKEAYLAVSQYTGDAKPSLTVIHGGAAA